MRIKTSRIDTYRIFLEQMSIVLSDSHKGQNGKVMIIGGSSLFHSAVLWPAEVASYFADMVHFASTLENNEVFKIIKSKWQGGIVVRQEDIPSYIEEDDAVLLGNGMMRSETYSPRSDAVSWNRIIDMDNEAEKTYYMTEYLLRTYPHKKWVLDAGALQMMDVKWLSVLKEKPILTPHQREFHTLFGENIKLQNLQDKMNTVQAYAKKHHCVILLKAGTDIISDGEKTAVVEGGNAGLTKGGTGDILAGLCTAIAAKNSQFLSAVLASVILKKTADNLLLNWGYWFDNKTIIRTIPPTLNRLLQQIKQ